MKQHHPNKLECEQLRALSPLFGKPAPDHQMHALGSRLIHNMMRDLPPDKITPAEIKVSAQVAIRMQTFFGTVSRET